MLQSAAPSLAGPLCELLSALLAGAVELRAATWRHLLQLCVCSAAGLPTWLTLARMTEVMRRAQLVLKEIPYLREKNRNVLPERSIHV